MQTYLAADETPIVSKSVLVSMEPEELKLVVERRSNSTNQRSAEESRRRVIDFFLLLSKLEREQSHLDSMASKYHPEMTKPQQLAAYIRKEVGSATCDDCLCSELKLKTRQQANIITASFAVTSEFNKDKGRCSICGETKLVTSVA